MHDMNTKKIITVLAAVAVVAVCVWQSVKVTDLAEYRALKASNDFSPDEQVDRFWSSLDSLEQRAVAIDEFEQQVNIDPDGFAWSKGRTLGIGAPYSLLVVGEAAIVEKDDQSVLLDVKGDRKYSLRTGFIFGNTVREASGMFSIDDYRNTMDFNMISSDINRRITDSAVAEVLDKLTVGTRVGFFGAVDVKIGKPLTEVNIVPLRITVIEQ